MTDLKIISRPACSADNAKNLDGVFVRFRASSSHNFPEKIATTTNRLKHAQFRQFGHQPSDQRRERKRERERDRERDRERQREREREARKGSGDCWFDFEHVDTAIGYCECVGRGRRMYSHIKDISTE